jgi:hypothetical protein
MRAIEKKTLLYFHPEVDLNNNLKCHQEKMKVVCSVITNFKEQKENQKTSNRERLSKCNAKMFRFNLKVNLILKF